LLSIKGLLIIQEQNLFQILQIILEIKFFRHLLFLMTTFLTQAQFIIVDQNLILEVSQHQIVHMIEVLLDHFAGYAHITQGQFLIQEAHIIVGTKTTLEQFHLMNKKK